MEWKKEFIKLYISNNVTEYGMALELKCKHIPNKLYRYRSLSDETMEYRFGEIVRGELYMSHPMELNDPFEAKSHMKSNDIVRYAPEKETYEEIFSEKLSQEIYTDIFNSENWLEKLMLYVSEQSGPKDKVEETKDILCNVIMKQYEELNEVISDLARRMVRFASFTTKPDNLPMWHHYTNGHKGICLEYNTEDLVDIYQKNMLFPVYYVDRLPDIVYMMHRRIHPEFSLFRYMAMHKLMDWSYEDEWRLIYDAGSWYYGPEDISKEFWEHGKVIRFICPTRIIMGVNIDESHENKIKEMAQLANIPLTKAIQTEYGLKTE